MTVVMWKESSYIRRCAETRVARVLSYFKVSSVNEHHYKENMEINSDSG